MFNRFDRIKQDIDFKNKVLRITLIIAVLVVAIIVVLFSLENDTKKNKKLGSKGNKIMKNLIPADTTDIIDDKKAIYRQNESSRKRENKALSLVKNENAFGLNEEEVKKKELENKKNKIDDYMKNRNRQIKKNREIAKKNREIRRSYSSTRMDSKPKRSTTAKKEKTPEELEAEYIKSLMDYRKGLISSSSQSNNSNGHVSHSSIENEKVAIRAVVYNDQFLIPGNRVRLILPKDVKLGDRRYLKGTDIYGIISISKSRVLLDIDNINHTPVNLVAKDIEDGRIGLYNEQAGKLWREYQQDLKQQLLNQAGNEVRKQSSGAVGAIINGTVNTFTSFFQRQNYTNRQKVLLLNDHEVILILKPENYDEIEKIQL